MIKGALVRLFESNLAELSGLWTRNPKSRVFCFSVAGFGTWRSPVSTSLPTGQQPAEIFYTFLMTMEKAFYDQNVYCDELSVG